jgi:hypothetical protein
MNAEPQKIRFQMVSLLWLDMLVFDNSVTPQAVFPNPYFTALPVSSRPGTTSSHIVSERVEAPVAEIHSALRSVEDASFQLNPYNCLR